MQLTEEIALPVLASETPQAEEVAHLPEVQQQLQEGVVTAQQHPKEVQQQEELRHQIEALVVPLPVEEEIVQT